MKLESDNMKKYLESSNYIDYNNDLIKRKSFEIKNNSKDNLDYIKKCFEFVRDEIKHSWDYKESRITIKASDVLKYKTGICWAKSNLLAALLRVNNIPTGFCYQKLTLKDKPSSGYCIHAFNAVKIEEINKWVKLDARGNNNIVNVEFSLDRDNLAFNTRKHYGEKEYDIIYYKPLENTMKVLKENRDALFMYLNCLPEDI
ncbi:transglutaminase-like domain-containing protein [Miniphocaeibacter halophilus]|uniref:Transglutaminase family protein n=1 Tax=Miniphocaeibacter halophilus TaxID=2931922 RepID=A0AC61MVR4_9FIRM|nr:transglutaminase family protein [Miniphocaeibacter halophilus]QQK07923.1 transglutaminase family protein [Miniphocaeibacter halophilus]